MSGALLKGADRAAARAAAANLAADTLVDAASSGATKSVDNVATAAAGTFTKESVQVRMLA